MSAFGNGTVKLRGRDTDGELLDGFVAAKLQGSIVRTIGTAGDSLTLVVKKAFWRPEGLDITKPMQIEFGIDGAELVLGGYYLRQELAGTFGEPQTGGTGEAEALEVMLRFVTVLGHFRDGRGGVLHQQTYNPLKRNGMVDTAHADFRTIEDLATLALSAIELDYDPAPASMNVVDPPAPADWGNCRALPELDGLVRRCCHAVALSNSGDHLRIVRLPQGGEDITIPGALDDLLLPYSLAEGPSIRPTKLIITSGRTRSTILTDRTLNDLEWVYKDSRTGRWLNDSESAALYATEIKPGDIAAFKNAPPRNQARRAEFKRLFSALRFKAEELPDLKRLVNFPDQATVITGKAIGGEACIVYAKCCVETTSGQFRNVDSGGSMIRIDGATAVAGEGVFKLPSEAIMVRMDPGAAGTYASAVALTDEDLQILFATQAHTGDAKTDYFMVGYNAAMSGSDVEITEMTTEELDEAFLDPEIPVISHDWLQRLLVWPKGELAPTLTNDTDLKAAAEKIAKVRMAGAFAKSGLITLKGLVDVAPGDWDGFVSAVQWDMKRMITIVSVGQHEVPDSYIEAIERAANHSFVSGFGRFTLPGSAVELSEVRAGGAPGQLGQVTNAAAPGDARGVSATRGAETSLPATAVNTPLSSMLERHGDQTRFMARITGNSVVSANRWSYAWEEVYLDDSFAWQASGRTHSSHGRALNGMEASNTGSGLQGNGVNVDTLPTGFTIQPIANGTVHEMLGPFGLPGSGTSLRCHFSAPNAVDGECEE